MGFQISIAIANKDTSESHRKNEGDIIAIKPYPWNWGTVERKQYLIVNLELPDNFPQAKINRLMAPEYSDGAYEDDDLETPKTVTNKRRFNIPGAKILAFFQNEFAISINVSRMRDDDDEYQPVEHLMITKADIGNKQFLRDKFRAAYLSDDGAGYTALISD